MGSCRNDRDLAGHQLTHTKEARPRWDGVVLMHWPSTRSQGCDAGIDDESPTLE